MRTLTVSMFLLIAVASAAHAVSCDRLELTNDAEDVVFGEAGFFRCFHVAHPFMVPPYRYVCVFVSSTLDGHPADRRLGVCWRKRNRAWEYKQTECTTNSVSTNYFELKTKGGNDRVAVLMRQHTARSAPYAMSCSPSARDGAPAIAPWNADFGFYIKAFLGTGSDVFHGSPNGDKVFTNETVNQWGPGPRGPILLGVIAPADRSNPPDIACGWDGNDELFGDLDDNYLAGEEDWLDGGPGTDLCSGDSVLVFPSPDRGNRSDLWRDCETHYGARAPSAAGLGSRACTATDDPLHEWTAHFP